MTLEALIGRVGASDGPAWLDGDLVGVLTDLTGERFAYDLAAWRRWWAGRRAGSEAHPPPHPRNIPERGGFRGAEAIDPEGGE